MRRLYYIAYPLTALLAFIVYSNTFDVPFVFDDGMYIIGNPEIRALSNLWPPTGTRWLSYISFALNFRIGGLDVFGYHLLNTAIHAANAVLVFFIVSRTFATPWMKGALQSAGAAFGVAFISSVIFAVHPLQTQAVTYVTQRFASLAALFYLLSLASYIAWRARDKNGALIYALSFVFAVCAQFTKEIAFTLPAIILFYETAFYDGPYKKRLFRVIPFLFVMLIIPFMVLSAASGEGAGVSSNIMRKQFSEMTGLSPYSYFVTELRVIVTYLRLLVLPMGQNIDYSYPVYNSILAPGVLASFLFLLSLLVAAVCLFVISRKRSDAHLTLVSAGVFWFFITLSVESSVIPIQDVIFEHRLYLPSIGAFAAFSAFAFFLKERLLKGWSNAAFAVVLAVLVALPLGAAAYVRNEVWRDDAALWKDAIAKSPLKARPHASLGDVYLRRGLVSEAIPEFEKAVSFSPDAVALHNLGAAYFAGGLYGDAVMAYRASLEQRPDKAGTRHNLALSYLKLGMIDEAEREFEEALRFEPDRANSHYELALIYERKGWADEAEREFEAARVLKQAE